MHLLSSDCSVPQTYSRGAMKYWDEKIATCMHRCDLHGLPKPKKDEVGECYITSRELTICSILYGDVVKFCINNAFSPSSVLQFVFHKAIRIFGDGDQTVMLLLSPNNENDTVGDIIPMIFDHTKDKTVLESTRCIERKIRKGTRNHISFKQAFELAPDALFEFGGASNSAIPGTRNRINLFLQCVEANGFLQLRLYYAVDLFQLHIIDGFLDVIHTMLAEIVTSNGAQCTKKLKFLPIAQKDQLASWNNTDGEFPADKRLHHLFEEVTERCPDKLAVVCSNQALTYQELNERSNQLAHYLHATIGIRTEEFIGICLDKTEVILICVFGIWKSGAAYVPVDPTYPNDRMQYIIQDSMANFIITNQKYESRLQGIFSRQPLRPCIIPIEYLLEELNQKSVSVTNLGLELRSSQLAYVTYTSGTTGVPKGVFKEHKGVVNSITDLSDKYSMKENPEVVVLFSGFVWEPFVRQSLIALLNSHKLVIVSDVMKLDPVKFPQFLIQHGVTYLNGTASVLQEFDLSRCKSITKLILVGEEFTKSRYLKLREIFKRTIISEYGFTESALVTAMKIFQEGDGREDRSIGRPLRNVKCYILDKNGMEVPIGAIGELHIGGVGISRGYLNSFELTQQKFLQNPFQSKEEAEAGLNTRMYKTGDLARWMSNGEVEYIGRNDFQVKLRGIRIEPREIESIVLDYGGVTSCAVAVKCSQPEGEATASHKHLVGYFVSSNGVIREDAVLEWLETKLPKYMMPVRMIQVDHIPVTINGKIDFRSLPEIDLGRNESVAGRPTNAIECKLVETWSEVLGISPDKIGIRDDFFRLGGHSIICIQIIARIRQSLKFITTVDSIFGLRTIEKISKSLVKAENDCQDFEAGGRFLANSLQQGLMYYYLKQSLFDDAYMIQSEYEYNTSIDVQRYKEAWEKTQLKFSSLRLRFVVKEEVYQICDKEQKLDWRYLDLSSKIENQIWTDEISKLKMNDRKEGFSLEVGQLFRIYLIKCSADRFSLLFTCHHIILDGWSFPILFAFVNKTYLDKGEKDFEQDKAYLQTQHYLQLHRNDHLEYWKNEIGRIEVRADLSGLLNESSKSVVQLRNYDRVQIQKQLTLTFSQSLKLELATFIASEGITLHTLLQFAWHKLLHAYGGGTHTVVGTVVSGRNLPVPNIENSVGLFINTLPLVVDHQSSKTSLIDALNSIQSCVNLMNSKSNVELGRLENKDFKRGLFDTLFVLESYPHLTDVEGQNRTLGFKFLGDVEKLDYPLAVIARETSFTLCYAVELFEEETIQNILELVNQLLEQVVRNPECSIATLNLVLPKQVKVMEAWNFAARAEMQPNTLHGVFEEMATLHPQKTALVYESERMTYAELSKKADQLATYIQSLVKIVANDRIALFLNKNELMILSILGVWKAGAAFVPIDPNFPKERIQFILEDTDAKLIITNTSSRHLIETIKKEESQLIQIEKVVAQFTEDEMGLRPSNCCFPTDLAYIIYTSGTTGTPKGVMVNHVGVVNLQRCLANKFSLRGKTDERLLSFSNYVFDHFVEQMMDALFNGQTLVILNDEMRSDKERLYKYMNDNGVTYVSGTPSVLSLYDFGRVTSLTRIDAVGEDFTEPLFNKIRASFKGLIINGYGPTEVSITTHKRLYNCWEERRNRSIGHQVDNISCYILDENLRRVPIGGIGDLYLGGVGLARGYLNREDLTAQAFIRNPLEENSRLYKTGDLARFLPNGETECLGRNDFQVKIRGMRIELSEIEAVILSNPGTTQAVAVLRDAHGTKCIVGYYVSTQGVQESELRRWIQKKLPAYMMPRRLIRIEQIPVSVSGKTDTKALPEVELTAQTEEFHPLRTEIEVELSHIWSDLLSIPADAIGREDDFFGLGGDSLRLTSLSFMISKQFQRTLPIAQILLNPTIASIGTLIELGLSETKIELIHNSEDEISIAQERLLFIDEMEGGCNAFNIQLNFRFEKVDSDILTKSLFALCQRHEALRTLHGVRTTQVLDGEQLHKVFRIETTVVRDNFELDEKLIEDSKYIFDLQRELPFKFMVYTDQNPQHVYLGAVFHHICFDGVSAQIFEKELQMIYNCFANKEMGNFPCLKYQYKDYARLQRQLLIGSNLQILTDHWLLKLRGVDQLNLLSDFQRPAKFDYAGEESTFEFDQAVLTGLTRLAKSLKVSLFSVLLSAYALTLGFFTSQKEIIIGTPVSNRSRSEFEDVIGFFVTLVVIKTQIRPASSISEYIRSVSQELIQARIHQELPLEKLATALGIEKDLSRHPLVQVVFTFDEFRKEPDRSELILNRYFPQKCFTPAKYDLNTTVIKTTSGLKATFNFASKIFRSGTISSIASTFGNVLHKFSTTLESGLIRDISQVDGSTFQKILQLSKSETKNFVPRESTLTQLFEVGVRENKEGIALVIDKLEWTYAKLNAKCNQLAHYLKMLGAGKEAPIALLLDKSELMIMSILGVWKCGAAYVPLDPSYPDERVSFILNDTGARIVITNERHSSTTRGLAPDIEVIVIDSILKALKSQPKTNLEEESTGAQLCYVIYTSGTTGRPKGVMVEHKGLVSLASDLRRVHGAGHRVLFLSNYVFDFSIEQILLSLFSSGTLILPPQDFALTDSFYNYVNCRKLTYVSGTPTFLQEINFRRLVYLERVTVAGEIFTEAHFSKIRTGFDGPLVNAYGVTETSVYNMTESYFSGDGYRNSLGNLFSNTQRFVLDENLRPVPFGAIGELYLSGKCLARGYLNRPDLDKNQFLPNPFQEESDDFSRLYKTGDLVRFSTLDGKLEYLGRCDTQVKIRGMRVELLEVESVLGTHHAIEQCAVVAKEKQLVAYVVSRNGFCGNEELISFLEQKLPSFMIPTRILYLPSLPKTINGKLDLRALDKGISESGPKTSFLGPRNSLEMKLSELWASSLGVQKVGIDDNFFELGGDSIQSLQLVSRIRNEMQLGVSVKDIFMHKTIRCLVTNLQILGKDYVGGEQGLLSGKVPLLPIQKWFFAKNLRQPACWNQSFMLHVPVQLDLPRLQIALNSLIQHHDALRLKFEGDGGVICQRYVEFEESVTYHKLDISTLLEEDLERQLASWQIDFNLTNGPMFAIAYLTGYPDGSARIWWAIHHLLVDTVSWRIIKDDLETLYNGGTLGQKGSSYREFSVAVESYYFSDIEDKFWEDVRSSMAHFNLSLKRTRDKPINLSFLMTEAETEALLLSGNTTPQILNLCLAALGYGLQEVTKSNINFVTLEGHGREESIAKGLWLGKTVGWFTSMYPFQICTEATLDKSISAVEKLIARVPQKGIGYGAKYGYVSDALPCVTFNYLGKFEPQQGSGWEFVDISKLSVIQNREEDDLNNLAAIDVTGLVNQGKLSFQMQSYVGVEESTRMMNTFKTKLAHIVEERKGSPNKTAEFDPPYFVFNKNKGQTIFLFPPGEGGAESYFNNLVPHLYNYRLVIFNNYYLSLGPGRTETFEELASIYIKYILEDGPRGSWNFLGWSFGGVLALEVARQISTLGKVQNLFIIDSYFNVKKACEDIGRPNVTDIIDPINYFYSPKLFPASTLPSGVILFKPLRLNEMYKSSDQFILYDYYRQSGFNNLDTILSSSSIKLVELKNDSHNSWVNNSETLHNICATIDLSVRQDLSGTVI